jgi:hypothetical protein
MVSSSTPRPQLLLLLALLCLLLSPAQCSAYEPLRKVVIESPKEAVCLDGTSPAVFVRPADPANWVIFFQGGDQCMVSNSTNERFGRGGAPTDGQSPGKTKLRVPTAASLSGVDFAPQNAPFPPSLFVQTSEICLRQMQLDLQDRDVLQL